MHVVLLHGFGETEDIWKTFIPSLNTHNEYLTLDYSRFTFCQTIEEYADWLHAEILQRKIRYFVLIGHSMGGYIALAYAKKYGDFVAGLGLFHSTAFADSEDKKLARDKTIKFLAKHGAANFIEDFLPKMYNDDFLRKNKTYIKQQLLDNQQIPTEALQVATTAMKNREDTRSVLEAANYPVLHIIGKADKFIDFGDALTLIPLLKKPYVLIIDNIAHAGMHEAPEVCAAV
ncbi:MAG: alpha/beta hydrolase, partial [Spirosomaceae bacterium]|nr:alpha/beta hydrolase [Spirosomataceae bacterium]